MHQLDLFDRLPCAHLTPADFGCVWWAGDWECRNWRGWFQSREGGKGLWRFQIVWFACDDATCSVYGIGPDGSLETREGVPIDRHNRILIENRRYGREHWAH